MSVLHGLASMRGLQRYGVAMEPLQPDRAVETGSRRADIILGMTISCNADCARLLLMSSRWYNIAVLGLWLTSMGWLVTAKIIPPLLSGDPPNYADIADSRRYDIPIGWRLLINGKPVGWALSMAERKRDGETEVRSRVHFDHVPLEELTPTWLRGLLGQMVDFRLERRAMDCESTLTIDAEGCLRRLRSAIHCGPVRDIVCLRGKIEGTQLKMTVRSGNFSFTQRMFRASEGPGGRHPVAAGVVARFAAGSDLERSLLQSLASAEQSTGTPQGDGGRAGADDLVRPHGAGLAGRLPQRPRVRPVQRQGPARKALGSAGRRRLAAAGDGL